MDLELSAIGIAIGKQVLLDGRALFVEEWMKPLAGDDEVPSEAEALAEFARYLRDATK